MLPLLRVPRHPIRLARFGLRAALPATAIWRGASAKPRREGAVRRRRRPRLQPPDPALQLGGRAGADLGLPPPRLAGRQRRVAGDRRRHARRSVRENGGTIETGRPVRSLEELPAADAVVFDLAPGAVAEIAGEPDLGRGPTRGLRRYRHGPGAFKVDLAVEGGVPWAAEGADRAGTVHAAGGFEEIVAAERDVNRGRMPERPFVLVGQQYLADPGRSEGDVHPVWSYCHVPKRLPGRRDRGGHRPDRALCARPARADRRPPRPFGRPASRPTTPTTSAATSSPARRTGSRR